MSTDEVRWHNLHRNTQKTIPSGIETDQGWVFVKCAPLPYARGEQIDYDLSTKPGM